MERVELAAHSRTVRGKKTKQLRAQNLIPAVVYGPGTDPSPIQAQERALHRALRQASTTTLISLQVDADADPQLVLARDIQRDIMTGRLLHVDFYRVNLKEKVKTMPRLEFVGESPLVKAGMAVLLHAMTEIEVECLPTDLISFIEVDVSVLERMDDSVTVGDLPLSEGVTILAGLDEVVASVVPVRTIEEEAAEEEVELVEGELVEEDVEDLEE
jgi:large subunit ribosomal protein L25